MPNNKIIDLDRLSRFKDDYDNALETGQIVPSKSLVAKEIENVSPESGDTQETPFALQGTGTANGTSSVDTGTVGKHIQKQGSVYCVNQHVIKDLSSIRALNPTGTWSDNVYSLNGLTFTVNNGTIIVNGTASSTTNFALTFNVVGANKKWLFKGCPSGGSNSTYCLGSGLFGVWDTGNGAILNADSSSVSILNIRVFEGTQLTNAKFTPDCINLTQWFNGNIPSTFTPENAGRYGMLGLAYNTGTLVSGNGRYLVNGGRNQFNGVFQGGSINSNTGAEGSGNDNFRTDFISVNPNTPYHIRWASTFTTGSFSIYEYDINKNYIGHSDFSQNNQNITLTPNTRYIRCGFYKSGSSWKTNTPTQSQVELVFSLYYAGEDYSQYYPYEEPKVYDTGNEELLSTGVKLNASGEREDIYDYKEPNGLITRRVGKYTFTSADDWVVWGSGYRLEVLAGKEAANVGSFGIIPMISDTGLEVVGREYISNGSKTGISCAGVNIVVSNTTGLTGKTIYYELATPTTEQGTPYSENIEINDFGTMGWYSSYTDYSTNTLVSVPQGCKIFYPAWYVGFIDTLGQREDVDWDANNVVSQTELGVESTARSNQDTILLNAIGGTLRQMLAINQSLDFLNTDFVNLGSLTWTYYATSPSHFSASLSGVKVGTNKILCTKYKAVASGGGSSITTNMTINIHNSSAYVQIKDDSYTDADTFKNAMKGVLLAYEKASS